MKSMLHEGSSIIKAIEKAWKESGQPSEFTVNVLEVGEKNFLGLSRRPAIVSITYEPNSIKVAKKQQKNINVPRGRQQPMLRPKGGNIQGGNIQGNNRQVRKEGERFYGNQQQQKPVPVPQKQPIASPEKKQTRSFDKVEYWSAGQVADISGWLKEILAAMNINVAFDTSVDNKVFKIVFRQNIFASRDEERQLFGGLSYLLLQLLKKKQKQKLRGYHLVISSKDHAAGEKK